MIEEQLWRPPVGGVPGPWRPPTGAWPPPPPVAMPRPPDFFSWFFWLNQNYADAIEARKFFMRILQDLLVDQPDLLAQRQAIVGVTDGSAAQPGMVGEKLRLDVTVNFPATAGATTQVVSVGVLPPGDWDVWAYTNQVTNVTGLAVWLDPMPAGFDDRLEGGNLSTVDTDIYLTTYPARALIAVPTLLAFSVMTWNPQAAGSFHLVVGARRRR